MGDGMQSYGVPANGGGSTINPDPLAEIVAHGNRGHGGERANWLHCADGFTLSVIAGGGTYCQPRPAYCLCQLGAKRVYPPLQWEVLHDFPGPYTHVEVMVDDPGPGWEAYDSGGVYGSVPVALVAQLVAAHGGCTRVEAQSEADDEDGCPCPHCTHSDTTVSGKDGPRQALIEAIEDAILRVDGRVSDRAISAALDAVEPLIRADEKVKGFYSWDEMEQRRSDTAERIAQAIEECPHHVTCSIQLHVNNPRRRCTCHIEPLARIAREHADEPETGGAS